MGFLSKIKEIFLGGNILYYPGCLTHFVLPGIEENYKKLLNMMEIDYISIPDFNCCGSPAKNAGYKKDFNILMQKNKEMLNKYGVKKIITNCPACYIVLKDQYGLKVEHISQVLVKNMDKINKDLALDVEGNKITYHDPCHLGRQGHVYEEPRQIIKSLGLELHEFPSNLKKSLCCGAGGGLRNNNPKLAHDIAKSRIKLVDTKTLITPCPMCYMHFKENAKDIKVIEFSELLLGKIAKPVKTEELHDC